MSTYSLSPKHNYLLLEAISEDARTKSGLYLPDNVRQKLNMGKIIEANPDVLAEADLKVGEIVMFPFHVEYRFPSAGKEYILVRADEVIAGDNCTTVEEPEKDMEVSITEKLTNTGRRAPIGL